MEQNSEIDVLARTIYGEARGEGYPGIVAVACVVMNRALIAAHYVDIHGKSHPLFGDGSFASACKVPWQFSSWNENDPNLDVIMNVTAANPIFSECINIAGKAVALQIDDTTKGATHYFDRRLPQPPAWAEGKTPCAAVGHHLFFNDVS